MLKFEINAWGSKIFLVATHNNNKRLFEGNQEKKGRWNLDLTKYGINMNFNPHWNLVYFFFTIF
jgi:hypothetical protein